MPIERNSASVCSGIVFAVTLLVGSLMGAWMAPAWADHASFKDEIAPILNKYCVECHNPGGVGYEASGLDLTSYEGIMKGTKHGPVIVPGDAFTSNLMVLIEGRANKKLKMPHDTRGAPTKEDRIALRKWITDGAGKDGFTRTVQPIIRKYCIDCHVPGGIGYAKSGLNMQSYETFMKGTKHGPIVVAGDAFVSNLMVVIDGRASSYLKMPHGTNLTLSKWEKHLIRAWISGGAKNN